MTEHDLTMGALLLFSAVLPSGERVACVWKAFEGQRGDLRWEVRRMIENVSYKTTGGTVK